MEENFEIKICNVITSIIFAVCFAYILSYVFFTQILQQGFSMAPTINDRNIVVVNRLYKSILPIKRNDIISFYVDGKENIKRVYGLPFDKISISNGNLYINDNRIDEVDLKNSLSSNIEQNIKLAENEYYVLGDNLDSSKDSRFSDIGNIKRQDIIGKVWYIIKK